MSTTRRDFLKIQAGTALLLAAGTVVPGMSWAAGKPDVAVVKGNAEAAVRAAVDLLGGMKSFVKPGQKVVIKPNMSFAATPDMAPNTNPEVVAAVVALCKKAGASRIRVLDHVLSDANECMNLSGIKAACNKVEPDSVHALSNSRFFKETDIQNAKTLTSTKVMKEVLDADVLISVPKAKSHSGAGVSLSLKGNMGLIKDRGVFHWKHDLHEAIVDLYSLLKPALTVVDATTALTTGGPWGPGKVVRKDLVIASTDGVAADAQTVISYKWYGKDIKPRQVRHLRLAHERGLGRMDVENLNVAKVEIS